MRRSCTRLINQIEVILGSITNRWNTFSSGLEIFLFLMPTFPLTPFIYSFIHPTFNKYSAILLHAMHYLCRTHNKVLNDKYMITRCHNGAYILVDSGVPHSPSFPMPLPTQSFFAIMYKCLLTDSFMAFGLQPLLLNILYFIIRTWIPPVEDHRDQRDHLPFLKLYFIYFLKDFIIYF